MIREIDIKVRDLSRTLTNEEIATELKMPINHVMFCLTNYWAWRKMKAFLDIR